MIDVGDDIVVVVPRVKGREKTAVAVVMVKAFAISVGQTKVAYTPRDGNGKVWFASRDRVFRDFEQLNEAYSFATCLAGTLGVGIEG